MLVVCACPFQLVAGRFIYRGEECSNVLTCWFWLAHDAR